MARAGPLLLVTCLGACQPTEDPGPPGTPPSPPRLLEVGLERGLTRPLSDPSQQSARDGFGGHVVAADWDGDGDIDLLFDRLDAAPDLYENDGAGFFTLQDAILEPHAPGSVFPMLYALGADLDGDLLPELLIGGDGAIARYPNLGGLQFGHPERVFEQEIPRASSTTAHLGDLDGDGDLDLIVPSTGPFPDPGVDASHGTPFPTRVARWDGARWVTDVDLFAEEGGAIALTALLTDQDDDGRLDALVPGDQEWATGFFHNDGLVDGHLRFTDRAQALNARLRLGAMGADGTDWSGDGRLDFCISNTGRIHCLESLAEGYVENGLALGVDVEDPVGVFGTIGWTVVFADLDRDGRPELLQASGPFSYGDPALVEDAYPCLLFSQLGDGRFVDWTAEAGLDLWGDHPGVVVADLDGDQCTDAVFAGPRERPAMYLGVCEGGGAVEVDLEHAGAAGFGARVEVHRGGRVAVQQRSSLLGAGQSSGILLFGLGEASKADLVRVIWPGGRRDEWTNVPAGTRIEPPLP